MKAVVIRNPGRGFEAWSQVELPKPEAGPGQVLIRLRAASLNYRDLLAAQGHYGGPLAPDLVPLVDGAGEIAEVGPGVTRWKIGDRVMVSYFQTWQSGPMKPDVFLSSGGTHLTAGTLAQYTAVGENAVVRVPSHLSFEEAATLPCTAVTAWQAMMEPVPRVFPGSTVVVQGTGGVSVVAAQLALASGLRVIATSSSDAKLTRLKELGVHDVINYRTTPEWQKEVLRLTGGEGADQIIEVGGTGTLSRSFEAVRTGGTISLIGLLTGLGSTIDPMPVLFKAIRLEGIVVGSVTMFESLNRALEALRIVPVVDEVFPFARAVDALKKLAAGSHFGKLVIQID